MRVLKAAEAEVRDLAFSPDGRALAVAVEYHGVFLWNLAAATPSFVRLPAEGGYYPGDPDTGKHTAPLPRAGLTKFDGVPGVSRVYDSGDIEIYDMRGA